MDALTELKTRLANQNGRLTQVVQAIAFQEVVTLQTPTQAVDNTTKAVSVPIYADAVSSVPASLTPLNSQALYAQTGIELTDPYWLTVDVAYASYLKVGNRVVWGSKTLVMKAPSQDFQSVIGTFTNHSAILCENLVTA